MHGATIKIVINLIKILAFKPVWLRNIKEYTMLNNYILSIHSLIKCKVIPLQARCGPEGG